MGNVSDPRKRIGNKADPVESRDKQSNTSRDASLVAGLARDRPISLKGSIPAFLHFQFGPHAIPLPSH